MRIINFITLLWRCLRQQASGVSRIRLLYWIASAAATSNRINKTIRFYCLSICQQSLGFINALIMGRGGTPTVLHFVNIIYDVAGRQTAFSRKFPQRTYKAHAFILAGQTRMGGSNKRIA